MGLRVKFNLTLLLTFIVAFAIATGVGYRIVQNEARREAAHDASLMMAEAAAVRDYTATDIAPLLAEQEKSRFLPQAIPFWAAQTTQRAIAVHFPHYTYKEAALNPINIANRAAGWEEDIVAEFQHSPELGRFTSTRELASGPTLSLSQPIRVTDQSCLACHSTPEAAPAAQIDVYGTRHGFGWKLGDTVGAQIASVPMQDSLNRANRTLALYLGGLAALFAATLLLLNLVLHFVVIRPLRRIVAHANAVSTGNFGAPEFELRGHDEIAVLLQSFNRMRRSLANAMQMLESSM